jgi:uncharacterized protein
MKFKNVFRNSGIGIGRGGPSGGRLGGPQAGGPGGLCLCPKCGYEMAHERGTPCDNIKCPKCQSKRIRKE